jgi:hypothetical protein
MSEERNWRSLFTGLMEFAEGKIYTAPEIQIAKPEGGYELRREWSNRNFSFALIGGLDSPICAHVNFLNGCGKREDDVPLYKLFSSKRDLDDGIGTTLKSDLMNWLEGRVFVTPELIIEGADGLSERPYRFADISYADAPICSHIKYLDGKIPNEFDILFGLLLRSEEIPPEEVAKRMKKE